MSEGIIKFLRGLSKKAVQPKERSIGLLWFNGLSDPSSEMSVSEICSLIFEAGYPKPNSSRLATQLKKDNRVMSGSRGKFRIKTDARPNLDTFFLPLTTERELPLSDSLVPMCIVHGTRGYLEKVVQQINVSYDIGLYDCCAVMCRRLLETLIIEIYEHKGWTNKIKNSDGNFKMFSGLLMNLLSNDHINLGRNTKRGLQAFKELGDKSAHDRRFNARRQDIRKIESGLRSATEELLHLAGLT
jgi:hypothetical protein